MALIRRLLLSVVVLACSCFAPAAVAFDSAAGVYGSGPTITWSHTCTGSSLVLVVGIAMRSNSASVTRVTYNGVALIQVGTTYVDSSNTGYNLAQFYLASPATGTHTVSVTVSNANGVCGISQSFTGCSGTVNNQTTATGGGFLSIGVPSAAGNYVADISVCVNPPNGRNDTNLYGNLGTSYFYCSGGSSPSTGSTQTVGINNLYADAICGVNIVAGSQARASGGLATMGVG